MARKVISYNKRHWLPYFLIHISCNAEKEGLGLLATFIYRGPLTFYGLGRIFKGKTSNSWLLKKIYFLRRNLCILANTERKCYLFSCTFVLHNIQINSNLVVPLIALLLMGGILPTLIDFGDTCLIFWQCYGSKYIHIKVIPVYIKEVWCA